MLALDARSGNLAEMCTVLFAGDGEIHPDLEAELVDAGPSSAVLIEEIVVDAPWETTRVGAVALGLALREAGRGCVFAAIREPAPGPEARASAELGFRLWRDDVHVLDLATTALGSRMAAILGHRLPTRDPTGLAFRCGVLGR